MLSVRGVRYRKAAFATSMTSALLIGCAAGHPAQRVSDVSTRAVVSATAPAATEKPFTAPTRHDEPSFGELARQSREFPVLAREQTPPKTEPNDANDKEAAAPTAPSAGAPSAGSTALEARHALEAALCDGRADCKLQQSLGGITTKTGARHEVWRTTFAEAGPADDTDCTYEEYWLVARDPEQRLLDHRSFAKGCEAKSPPSAWCGLPPRAKVRVRGTTVESDWEAHALRCMSVFHSTGRYAASLETFAPLREESTYFRMVSPHEETKQNWDFRALRGSTRFSTWGSSCKPLAIGPRHNIPSATVPQSFIDEGWRTLDIKQCSTKIDRGFGFALGGSKANVALQLLLARDGSLFIDLAPATSAAELPKTAELHVCAASFAGDSYAYCHDPNPVSCTNLRLDGTVIAGDFSVERAPQRPRFKVELPTDTRAVTVVYVEPQSGRSLASSPLKPTDYTTLGEVFPIDENLASCEVRDSELKLEYRAPR